MKTLINLIQNAGEFKKMDDFDLEGFAGASHGSLKADIDAGKAVNEFCQEHGWEYTDFGLILILDGSRLNVIHPVGGHEVTFNIN